MEQFSKTERNTVKRVPKRGHYDKKSVYEILDAGFIAHVGFSIDGQPFVIPTAYGRKEDQIYLHGATTSRMIQHLQTGVPVCITVTFVDGVVLARSVFHHSANYRSAVVFGTARLATDEEKMDALEAVTEHIHKGRWEEARQPNAKELKATSVLIVDIEQGSAKIRTGGPSDDKEDYELPIWAGVIPMDTVFREPITDPLLKEGIPMSPSVLPFAE
jgi:nitroimidazol reductase NimA-like FMN-containing flavoprotein (pyridoxamine 5'-phosphate oxidase superfamily)